jgi:hypothetical protein
MAWRRPPPWLEAVLQMLLQTLRQARGDPLQEPRGHWRTAASHWKQMGQG